jgi:DNA-binding protein HU-beta
MNKADLIEAVAEKTGLTKKQVGAVIDSTVETIEDTVADGDKVEMIGFGSFEKRYRNARGVGGLGVCGAPHPIAETYVPAFKPGKRFKEKTA